MVTCARPQECSQRAVPVQEEGEGSGLGASWALWVRAATQTPHRLGEDSADAMQETGPGPSDLIRLLALFSLCRSLLPHVALTSLHLSLLQMTCLCAALYSLYHYLP